MSFYKYITLKVCVLKRESVSLGWWGGSEKTWKRGAILRIYCIKININ